MRDCLEQAYSRVGVLAENAKWPTLLLIFPMSPLRNLNLKHIVHILMQTLTDSQKWLKSR